MKALSRIASIFLELLADAPANAAEGMICYDAVYHEPLYHDGTGFRPFGTSGDPDEIAMMNSMGGMY